MIDALLHALATSNLPLTDEEFADVLWLASYMDLPANASTLASAPQVKSPLATSADAQNRHQQPIASAQAEVHLPKPSTHDKQRVEGMRAVSFRSPAATALPGKLALARALRPILRKIPSSTQLELDEVATAEEAAEEGRIVPQLRPSRERWLDVAVVIDDWQTMAIWQQTIAEFIELLQQLGAFRALQTYLLSTKDDEQTEQATLQLFTAQGFKRGRICSPDELVDPRGRRLTLVLTDCTSPAWSSGAAGQLLSQWGNRNIVTLVQMLPADLWNSCALADAIQIAVSAPTPGIHNAKLTVERPWYWDDIWDEDRTPAMLSQPVPIITLEPEALHRWAQTMVSKGGSKTSGFYLSLQSPPSSRLNRQATSEILSPEERWRHFRATASPMAQELAGYLSSAPLSLPVMRLVQQVMLPQSRQVHLAEVLRSGLIRRITVDEQDGIAKPEKVYYDFIEGVRQSLITTVLLGDTKRVLEEVSKHVSKQDANLRNFHALILDPTVTGNFTISEENLPFATVTIAVLQRLGGQFTQLAIRLEAYTKKLREENNNQKHLENIHHNHIEVSRTNIDSYDLYLSYTDADRAWVAMELLPALEERGLRVCLADRNFDIGRPRLDNIERAITQSRHTLIVVTPAWLASEWQAFESLLVTTTDRADRLRRLIPLLLEPCSLPPRIAMLTYADFTDPAQRPLTMKRLLRALDTQAQIFISYKRHADPDEALALQLRTALESAGHRVFIDQTLPVGVAWAQAINRQIEASDFLVVLLSAASVQSEMVSAEVAYAHKHHQRTGKAKVLPVRIRYDEALPYQFSHYLESQQSAQWVSDEDSEILIRQLLDAIRQFSDLSSSQRELKTTDVLTPLTPTNPRVDPKFLEALYEPGGAMRVRSEFYIARAADDILQRELSKPHGTTIIIQGTRQTGRSSLLMRGIAQMRQQHNRVVYLDLQVVEPHYLETLDGFLHYFATHLVTQLRLDSAEVDKAWRGGFGAPDKMTYLLEDYVLPALDSRMVLALDEVDRLLGTPFQDTFFGLLRFWHNSRALNELWEKLSMVLAISTEPYLLIKDITQSPFNIGQKIRLGDFTLSQVQELNDRYRQPLSIADLGDFMTFLGGHPYLTHRALYTMVKEDVPWSQLKAALVEGQYSFGDHLRRYVWYLRDQPDLRDSLKHILRHSECLDETIFYRLLRSGLIKGSSRQSCTLYCGLYAEYLKDKL